MAGQLARAVARFIDRCPYAQSAHDLVSKQRVVLDGGYIFDLYFNADQGKYSYTLVRGGRRIIGWDNALHHPRLTNFPHHFHHEDGSVAPSSLTGVPEDDIEIVATKLNEFLSHRT
jgi:hypothetical protein